MNGIRALVALVLGVVVALGASGQERKAYKYVDEKGNVVYSQTPPVAAKDVKKVDIAPAHQGRAASTEPDYSHRYQQRSYGSADSRSAAAQEYQRRREEAQKKRLEELKAECNRNRGADCNNPDALRLIESQRIPGGRNYPLQR